MKFRKLLCLTLACGVFAGVLTSCGSGETTNASSSQTEKTYMSYAEYVAAEVGSEVTIKASVQAKQSWWSNKGTFYLADQDGAYFVYELPCTEEQYNTLTVGKTIIVKGQKGEWSGEVEIMGSEAGAEATWEIVDGEYIAPVKTVSTSEDLAKYMNQKVKIENLTVVGVGEDKTLGFLYKYDGSGSAGKNHDVYYSVTDGTNTFSFCVESYLCSEGTDVYTAATSLKPGDVITVEGFMYWYNAPQLHTTSITKA